MAKTRSASRSMKERLERARALESLKRARALKGQGLNIEAAIAKSIAESKKTGVTGKPFLIYREDAETIMKRHVDSKILPGKIDEVKLQLGWLYRSTLGFKKNNAKEELVNRLFGKKGKFGLLMVKPELYFKARQIKSLLEQMGFETVFLKTFVFNRQTLLRQYPHVLKDRETYWKFSLGAGGLLSGP
ncbi:MAG TPA: hypothetical protein VFF09_03775, partial [archaeon]|nr:hypothetical protein [archaeon]